MNPSPSLDVLVDMRCGLCTFTAKFLHAFDWRGELAFHNYHDPAVRSSLVPEMSMEELERTMHVLDRRTNCMYEGFDALRLCAWQLPLLWPIVPLLHIPGISHLGRLLYGWIAEHRHSKAS